MSYNKVVISGINTSQLIVLKESEKIELLKEIQRTGSKEARDRLIKGSTFFNVLCPDDKRRTQTLSA